MKAGQQPPEWAHVHQHARPPIRDRFQDLWRQTATKRDVHSLGTRRGGHARLDDCRCSSLQGAGPLAAGSTPILSNVHIALVEAVLGLQEALACVADPRQRWVIGVACVHIALAGCIVVYAVPVCDPAGTPHTMLALL